MEDLGYAYRVKFQTSSKPQNIHIKVDDRNGVMRITIDSTNVMTYQMGSLAQMDVAEMVLIIPKKK